MENGNDKKTPDAGKKKDLDALRARLGLKDAKKQEPAAKGPGDPRDAKAPQGGDVKTDGFQLDFGGQASGAAPVSLEELELGSVSKPKSKFIVILAAFVIGLAGFLFLGFHFGKDMGLRRLHNSSVNQSQHLLRYFFEDQVDPTGQQLAARVKAIAEFRDNFNTYYKDNINALQNLVVVLETGDMDALNDPEFPKEMRAIKKQIEIVQPLNRILEKYLSSVDEMTPHGIFGDQVYHPDITYQVHDYISRANKLHRAVSDLADALVLLQAFQWSPEPPTGVKSELTIWAPGGEYQEGIFGAIVEPRPNPKEKKEVKETVLCEQVKLPVQVPKCDAKPEEEPFEIHELDVFQKKVESRVITYHEFRVKKLDEERTATANGFDLYRVNIMPIVKPLVSKNYAQYSGEMFNRAIIFNEVIENLDRIKELANGSDPAILKEFLEQMAGEEEYFTL